MVDDVADYGAVASVCKLTPCATPYEQKGLAMRDFTSFGLFRAWTLAGLSVAIAANLPGSASAATKEIVLADRNAALKYCNSGKMPSNDVDYITGADAFAQYGPGSNCIQQAGAVDKFKKAIQDNGKRVSACNLVNAKAAVAFCESGAMGENDMAYIGGETDRVISGPSQGCVISFSTGLVSNALCK